MVRKYMRKASTYDNYKWCMEQLDCDAGKQIKEWYTKG